MRGDDQSEKEEEFFHRVDAGFDAGDPPPIHCAVRAIFGGFDAGCGRDFW